jgi:hypothetical protein
MKVRDKELGIALHRSPTQMWRSILGGVWDEVEAATVCSYAGIRIVDDEGWRKAMRRLRHLSGGGRHVAKELNSLSMWLRVATNFKQGETK